jgi:hypothetical protein
VSADDREWRARVMNELQLLLEWAYDVTPSTRERMIEALENMLREGPQTG